MATHYYDAVTAIGPDGYWRLHDTSGTTASAEVGSAGTYGNFAKGATAERTITYAQTGLPAISEGTSIKLGGDSPVFETFCYIRLPLPSLITDETSWTLTYIVKTPALSQDYSFYKLSALHKNGNGYSAASDAYYDLSFFDDKFNILSGGTFTPASSTTYVITIRNTVSGGDSTIDVFVDNTLVRTITSTTSTQQYDQIILGCPESTDWAGFAGNYQECAFFANVLSPAEIATLVDAKDGNVAGAIDNSFVIVYDNAGAPVPSGDYEPFVSGLAPRRWYKCDDITDGYTLDSGSDESHAQIAYFADSELRNRVAPGSPLSGKSIALKKNISQYESIRALGLFNTNTYTVSFWVRGWSVAAGVRQYIFGAASSTGSGAQVYIKDDTLNFYYTFWDSPFDIGGLSELMVTVTSNGSQYDLFVNGQPTGVTPVSSSSNLLSAKFGSDNTGGNGSDEIVIDEILIFDYVLSNSEIEQLYAKSTSTGDTTGAVVVSVQGSQTTAAPSTNTPPGNYCLSIQGSRREQITAQKTGSNNLHYFATAGLTTTPTSTPAGEVIPPTLRNPGNLYREINLNEFGIVKPSFGEIVIDNLGGVHDDLLSKKLDGQKATLYRGKKGAEFPGGFTQVLKSSIAGISADYNQIRLKLRDDLDFLDTPLLTKTFSGEGGIKGDSSVTGQPRSRHFLMSTYAPARLIDQSKLIYHISDNNAFDAYSAGLGSYWEDKTWFAYDGGVEIDRAGDYSTIYELENLSPDPGECRFYLNQDGGVYLRLGSPPAFDVRVKPYPVTGGGAGIDVPSQTYNISDIVNEVVPGNGAFGFTAQERIVTDNSETVAEFIADQARAFFYNVWTDRLGAIKVQRFNAFPETGSAVKTFSASEIINIQITNQIPAHKLIINSGETFPSSLATGAPAAVKDALSKTGYVKQIVSEDVTVKSSHKLSKPLQIDTKTYINASDESSIIYSYKTFFRERQYVQLDVVVNDETLALDINNTVGIEMPRLGFNTGKNFTITGVRHDFSLNRLVLTLWG